MKKQRQFLKVRLYVESNPAICWVLFLKLIIIKSMVEIIQCTNIGKNNLYWMLALALHFKSTSHNLTFPSWPHVAIDVLFNQITPVI